MKRYLKRACERAKSYGLSCVSHTVLIRVMLEDPTPTLEMCCDTAETPESTNGGDDDSPKMTSLFDYVFSEAENMSDDELLSYLEEDEDSRQKIAKLTDKVREIHESLSDIVFGQDNAVGVFTSGYFQAELLALTDKNRTRPCATYLFAGPPGVGKTFLAESAANILGLPFKRFDMSEYCEDESSIEFCGSDKVYKNGKAGNFTSFVSRYPKSVVLFDEIEKAHISVIHLFLQILDAGRIRDNYTDEEISLKDVIMIFTTNAGKSLYEESDTGDFSSVSRKVILKALQKDINPTTRAPYFPAAICSRFASGNVVMFNHIAAHDLRHIAGREMLRQAENFKKETSVDIEISDEVFATILFAEGGAADARTVRSRAANFFDGELYELFRLTASPDVGSNIGDIEKIKISVELPEENAEVVSLFKNSEKPEILVFSDDKLATLCSEKTKTCEFIRAGSVSDAEVLLHARNIKVVLLDLAYGTKGGERYLNIEDEASLARDFFRRIREIYPEIPVYLVETAERHFGAEEKLSFMRQGVRGIINISDNEDSFAERIEEICENIHQQQSMVSLAKSNKLITFETAQVLNDDGRFAEIKIFDLELVVAVESEDSKNILNNMSRPSVRFDDVIGANDAKSELEYFVEYLKDPKKYFGTGVRAPKGVLLYGPPGTGKTMLARAMASEAGVTFISAEGNQFLRQFVGEGPEKVHELFRIARKYAPSILFIDEIDAVARERGNADGKGIDETLSALLTEMDGFKNCDTARPVFVLAATNYDVEPGHSRSLDPAVVRRFDRRVYVGLPGRDDRVRYIENKISTNNALEQINNIAVRSTGMSLAELDSILELSLRSAIRIGACKVSDSVLEEAFETFVSGEKKDWDISQLLRIARHEAGHAFLCYKSGEMPSYVTVVARANHGGYMQRGDNEDKAIYTKEELLAQIRTSLGGRASEIVYYGAKDGVSSGAAGDLRSATAIARSLVCSDGMDEDFGLTVVDPASLADTGLESEIRSAVNKILSQEMKNAISLVESERELVDRLVDELIAKNHLTGVELEKLFDLAK